MWTRVVTHSLCICEDIILNHGDFDMVTIGLIINNDIINVNNIVSNNTTSKKMIFSFILISLT